MKEYFSHDYNARNDTKLVKLFMKHGLKGLGAYWCIIEMLYEEGGYLLRSEYERISFELRTELDFIITIIEDYDLFKKDKYKFWSETALDRLEKRSEKSEKARASVQKRWDKYKSNTNVKQTKNNSNTSKVKESKVNKSKDIYKGFDFFKNDFKIIWLDEFIPLKKKKKGSLSDRALTEQLNKIKILSKNNYTVALEILKKSVNSGWTDFYELKNNNNGQSGANTKGNNAGKYHSGKDKNYSGKL